LIVNLHSAGEKATTQATLSGVEEPAAARGFAVVRPSAASDVWNFETDEDLDYIAGIVNRLVKSGCVDRASVFAMGMSQGGDFASFIACQRPGLLRAVASVAVVNAYGPCDGWYKTPLLAFAGTADPIYGIDTGLSDGVPFSGNPANKPGPLTAETQAWAVLNGCVGEARSIDGDEAAEEFSFDCPADAEVRYFVHGGGHVWPGGGKRSPFDGPAVPDLDATGLILDFMSSYL